MTQKQLAASTKAQHRHQKLHPWSSPKVRASLSWGCCCLSSIRVWSGEQHPVFHSLVLMTLPSPSRIERNDSSQNTRSIVRSGRQRAVHALNTRTQRGVGISGVSGCTPTVVYFLCSWSTVMWTSCRSKLPPPCLACHDTLKPSQ